MERIDFKAVKERVTMPQVLARYGLSFRQSGKQLRGDCPLPSHPKDSKGTFSVGLEVNGWKCFNPACKASGGVLDFVMAIEGVTVREAAMKLSSEPNAPVVVPAKTEMKAESKTETTIEPNQPLKFALQGVNPEHAYVLSRISAETARQFGVGYYKSRQGTASMDNRVVIPIHSEIGVLTAYAGRAVEKDQEPRYKLPVGFQKSLVLFNLHRLDSPASSICVVEGYFDCMRVHEAGFPVVALMGSSLSPDQEKLLRPFKYITLFLDGDSAGMEASAEILPRLARTHFVRRVFVEGRQPDEMKREEIVSLLS